MDDPPTSISSGPAAARLRNKRAWASASASDVVLIGDVPLGLEAGSAAHGTTLGSYTSAWAASNETPRLTLRFGEAPCPLPERDVDRETHGLRMWWDPDRVWVDDQLGLTGTADGRGVWIGGSADRRKSLDRVTAFLFGWALASHDRDLVHAAGAVLPTGGVVLVLGGTGAGKSTLMGIALGRGWGVISDDLVVIRRGAAGGVEACGVRRRVALPPEVAAHAGEEAPALADDPVRARLGLAAERLTGGFHPVRAVVTVGHDPAPASRLTELTGREAFDAALAARVLASTGAVVRRWLPTAAALSRLPAFALRHGADPLVRLGSSGARLDDLAARIG